MKKTSFMVTMAALVTVSIFSNAQSIVQDSLNLTETGSHSTEINVDDKRKGKRTGSPLRNNVSLLFGITDAWIGVYYERLFNPYWGIDLTGGILGGSIGTKIYLPKLSNGKISFYSGISQGYSYSYDFTFYIPLGLTYLGEKGFRTSFDLGRQHYNSDPSGSEFGFNLRLGKSF